MAYTYNVNQTPGNGGLAMYQLIANLIAAGWTKVSDSDATTYSAGGTQVGSGAAGAGGFNNSNAWVHLRAPAVSGQQRSLTIQRGATTLAYRIKYSAAAGFSGGSPAALVTPTATDEIIIAGAGTDASPTFFSWLGTDGTFRWHTACGGAAESYAFYAIGHTSGAVSTAQKMIYMDILAAGSTAPGDVDPAVLYVNSSVPFTSDNINGPSASTNPRPGAGWMGATSSAGNFINLALYTPGNINVHTGTTTFGVSPFTSKDGQVPLFYMRSSASVPPIGWKGISGLIRYATMNRGNMDTLNVAGTNDKIYFNGLILPWNGSVPLT